MGIVSSVGALPNKCLFNKVTAVSLRVSESFELEASQHFLQLNIP